MLQISVFVEEATSHNFVKARFHSYTVGLLNAHPSYYDLNSKSHPRTRFLTRWWSKHCGLQHNGSENYTLRACRRSWLYFILIIQFSGGPLCTSIFIPIFYGALLKVGYTPKATALNAMPRSPIPPRRMHPRPLTLRTLFSWTMLLATQIPRCWGIFDPRSSERSRAISFLHTIGLFWMTHYLLLASQRRNFLQGGFGKTDCPVCCSSSPHCQTKTSLGKICCSSDREVSGTLFNYANIFLSGQL